MRIALEILLTLFCIQGLFKFAVGFLVPYSKRIERIAAYYRKDGRIISIYDDVTLGIIALLFVLLALTEMQATSFITGLVMGMLVIQIFIHRFKKTLPEDKAPPVSAPNVMMSYAIQAQPGLAWKEVIVMTALFVWALYMLITRMIGT